MLRLAADENFNNNIVRGLLRRELELDIVRVQDVGLSGADDPAVLEWAAQVEPGTSLRQFIREKASRIGATNLFAIDGFLHAIPLPGGFADILITSHAIGWQLEDELREIERVVKRGGYAIHLSGHPDDAEDNPLHTRLTSPEWRYVCSRYKDKDGWKRKYWKQISSPESAHPGRSTFPYSRPMNDEPRTRFGQHPRVAFTDSDGERRLPNAPRRKRER